MGKFLRVKMVRFSLIQMMMIPNKKRKFYLLRQEGLKIIKINNKLTKLTQIVFNHNLPHFKIKSINKKFALNPKILVNKRIISQLIIDSNSQNNSINNLEVFHLLLRREWVLRDWKSLSCNKPVIIELVILYF